ncbi:hypothetical protein [Niveispirillum fermenti]|uniref:hypothetical protein n=1 Tax=Niveispirillum fermenti TaxID=1233113 RepID=UPI003A8498B4
MHRFEKWVRLTSLAVGMMASSLPVLAAKVDSVKLMQSREAVSVQVTDLSPRFLDFHGAAAGLDGETRWALWQERYGFAAIPPTPEGMAIARRLLDEAWNRYPEAMPAIRAGAAGMKPSPLDILLEVTRLFDWHDPVRVDVVAFVGGFEANAFTAARNGIAMVAIPLEIDGGQRDLLLLHEMTHAAQIAMGVMSGGWEREVGVTVLTEGLACMTVKQLRPGRKDEDYVAHRPGWYDEAMAKAPAILRGIRGALSDKDSDSVFRFTMGTGTTGTEREAYIAGWLVVNRLLADGWTFPRLARVPEAEMSALVAATIDMILADTN